MRLDGWEVSAFGPLAEFSASDLAGCPLIVLLGENESGKSTFFEFLTTILFGFAPATADAHPYTPWSGGILAGSATLVLTGGQTIRVHRQLRTTPRGKVGDTEIGNHPLPQVRDLSREMFRSLHALTLDDARELETRTWHQVEERLLGGAAVSLLRPAREVLSGIEKRANALWRTDRRGRPRDKEVRDELKQLKSRRAEALARTRRTLEIRAELAKIEQEIAAVLVQERELATRLELAHTLLPVLRRSQEIAATRASAAELLQGWSGSANPRLGLDRLQREVAEQRSEAERVRHHITSLEQHSQLEQNQQSIFDREAELRVMLGDAGVHRQDLAAFDDRRHKQEQAEAVLLERAGLVLDGDLSAAERAALASLSSVELRARMARWSELRHRDETAAAESRRAGEAAEILRQELVELPSMAAEEELRNRHLLVRKAHDQEELLKALQATAGERGSSGPKTVGRWLAGSAMIAAAAGLLAWTVLERTPLQWLAAALAALVGGAGVAILLRAWRSGPSNLDGRIESVAASYHAARLELGLEPDASLSAISAEVEAGLARAQRRSELEARLAAAEAQLSGARAEAEQIHDSLLAAHQEVMTALADLPVAAWRLKQPGPDLASDLESLRLALRGVEESRREREAIEERIHVRRERARRLALDLGTPPDGDPMDLVPEWTVMLEEATALRRRAEEAREALPSLRLELEERERSLAEAEARLTELTTLLGALDPQRNDPAEGLRRIEEGLRLGDRADALEQSLAREHPDWPERVAEAQRLLAEGQPLDLATGERVELEQRAEEVRAQLQDRRELRVKLSQELANLAHLPGVDEIDGEIEALDEERARFRRERDRLALLASVIREADRRYRDRHQPPVLRQASEYLRIITGGRYDRIVPDEAEDGSPRIAVARPNEPFPRVADHPLSRGIREQIYLALRLALADQVDDEEPLPLVLDELLVNWDPARTRGGIRILRSIGGRRQVFILTCHPALAERFAQEAGATVVALPSA